MVVVGDQAAIRIMAMLLLLLLLLGLLLGLLRVRAGCSPLLPPRWLALGAVPAAGGQGARPRLAGCLQRLG